MQRPLIGLILAVLVCTPLFGQQYQRSADAGLTRRVADLERLLNSRGLLGMLQRLDALERDLARLQGDNELLQHRIDRIQLELEQARDAAGQPAPATATDSDPTQPLLAPLPPSPDQPSAGHAADGAATYRDGLALLRTGDTVAGLAAMQGYLQQYPDGAEAANAHYWIGEAQLIEGRAEDALKAFSTLVETYPNSPRVPNALLKIGGIYADQGQAERARQTFEGLRQDYPGSTAAKLAEQRLQAL